MGDRSDIEWTAYDRPQGRRGFLWLSDTVPEDVPTEQCGEMLLGIEVRYEERADGWWVGFSLDSDSRVQRVATEDDARERAEALVRAFRLVWREELAAQAGYRDA